MAAPPGAYPGGPALMPQPVAGMQMRPPRVPPAPGMVVMGYEVEQPQAGCCKCDGLSTAGLIAIILLVLIFSPLAWIPCVMPSCFEPFQRPVYGYPAGAGAPAPGMPMMPQVVTKGEPEV